MSFWSCPGKSRAAVISEATLEVAALGSRGKALVLAPHPDDEVFAVGGILSLMTGCGYDVVVLAVTDGEASHARSARVTPEELRETRLGETTRAYRQLGIDPCRIRMRLPDSQVCSRERQLREELDVHMDGATIVLAPIETDGHPDHDTVGRVADELGQSRGVPLWQYAVWARLNEERITQGGPFTVRLTPEVALRKCRAMQTYSSQFIALGPEPEDGPVLPADFVQHFSGNEEFLWPAS